MSSSCENMKIININLPLIRKLFAKYKHRTIDPFESSTGLASICLSIGLASSGLKESPVSDFLGAAYNEIKPIQIIKMCNALLVKAE